MERLDKVALYNQFNDLKFIFNSNFYDSEFCKILRPSVVQLFNYTKGNTETYNRRVEDRLPFKIFHRYKHLEVENSYLLECRPFNWFHYYHEEYIEHWKAFQLKSNKGIAKTINCSTCKSVVREYFIDSCIFDWNIDGSVTKVLPEKRIEVVHSEGVEQSTPPNFKERQVSYDKYEESLKAYLNRVIINSSNLDTITHPVCIKNTSDRLENR